MDLGIVGEEEVSVQAITDTNTNAAKKSIISPPSCDAADESDDSHDTLGIHYEDEPQTGGVLPDATKSVGSISAITTPSHYIPTPQIHIPDNSLIGSSRSGAVSTASRSTSGLIDGTSSGGGSSKQLSMKDRKQLAKENLAAGLLAMENTDFDTAVEFFAAGRKYLNNWDVDFSLMLRLCSEEAKACFITGDYDTMNVHINEIMSKDIPITDKFKAYETKILYQQEALQNYQESLDICIDVRKQLGMQVLENKHQSTLKIIYEFIKVNRALGKKTAEELANLPNLTDERLLMGQRMLCLMGNASFSVQPTLFPVISCLAFREALKHGIGTSPIAIAGFGIILCSFGNLKRGRELARAAELVILSKPGTEQSKAKTIYLCEGLINHWTLPIRDSLGPLLDGYNTGLKHGNLQDASLNQCFYVAHAYFAGMPLKEDVLNETSPLQTINDIETFAGDSKGDSRLDTHLANRIHSLVSANLRGDTLEGMNFDGILKYCTDTGNRALRGYVFVAQCELKVFFGAWIEAADLLVEAGELLLPEMVGLYQGVRYIFVCTLVYIKTAQSSTGLAKRKKFKKKALKKMKVIRGFVKKGHVSCVHNLHLLEAELAILDGNIKQIEDSYKLAIDVASKGGFLHDKALSHELASMYYDRRKDHQQSRHHMENAIKSYTEWGATAKVEKLTH